jgi:hypothetical protein
MTKRGLKNLIYEAVKSVSFFSVFIPPKKSCRKKTISLDRILEQHFPLLHFPVAAMVKKITK